MPGVEVNKLKFLVNCGAFTRYLTNAQSGVLALPVYDRNENNEVIVYVGEVFCRVVDCEYSRKTVGLREYLKLAYTE
ncbi:uncharacterized protein N7458_003676 [Penicillium daleae]|uniref:Uncharacterized protein n=1 Tax=Penicillium daleae TaxID=63821 RepID=A0AAD6CBV1_9EURO|nr:uncharacterized protein N7458_003676 [Penicillium daleae]KAJ5456093.1 hypothetical protein N7458_003676 [Penicillium daleae]